MDKNDFQLRARKDLRNHVYKQIAFGDFCEIWQCMDEKGSSYYGFDICISRFGISVHGDIDSLSFGVGTYYGMSFLAGKDIGYYIRSKLTNEFREQREVKSELIKEMIACNFFYILEEIVCDPSELESDEDEEDIGFKVKISENSEDLESMVVFANKVDDGEVEGIEEKTSKRICDLLEAYNEFDDEYFDVSEEHAYRIMQENTDIDLSDGLSITEPDESIMMRLYYVNHAAKQIMKIKTRTSADFRHMWT